MNNNYFFINIIRFILLVLVQVLVFNRLNFLGFINPMVYILFVYWYPIKQNRPTFIGLSFLLALSIDLFSDTMAINAASTITIAYIRPILMRFIFGINYEFQSFRLTNTTRAQQFTFLTLLIVVHHLVFFMLEVFSFTNFLLIFKKILSTSVMSLIICLLFSSLFSVKKE